MAGSATVRRYFRVWTGWISAPSATAPAASNICGPSAARYSGGGPSASGPGFIAAGR